MSAFFIFEYFSQLIDISQYSLTKIPFGSFPVSPPAYCEKILPPHNYIDKNVTFILWLFMFWAMLRCLKLVNVIVMSEPYHYKEVITTQFIHSIIYDSAHFNWGGGGDNLLRGDTRKDPTFLEKFQNFWIELQLTFDQKNVLEEAQFSRWIRRILHQLALAHAIWWIWQCKGKHGYNVLAWELKNKNQWLAGLL